MLPLLLYRIMPASLSKPAQRLHMAGFSTILRQKEQHILQVIRNVILAIIGLTLLIALMTAGFFLGLALLGAGLLFWGYLKLRASGMLGKMQPEPPEKNPHYREETITVIETDYEVVDSDEERDRKKRQ